MNLKAVLEGILFVVGDEGISLKNICRTMNIEEEEAKSLLKDLRKEYEKNERGIRISFLGNSFKLTTKSEHKEYYSKLIVGKNDTILSNASLETLAIVAYNEPVTRAQIEKIRGINSDNMVRKLVSRGFLKEVGKKECIGHPTLYGITDEFLDYFGLATKEDLPSLDMDADDESDIELYNSTYKEK